MSRIPFRASSGQGVRQFRQYLEQVADEPDIRNLEDRRFLVLVDRNDRSGILDSGHVLDGTRNPDCDIKIRGDDPSGLAHLHLVRYVTRVDRRPRRADTGAEFVGQRVDQVEVVFAAQSAPAGHHASRGLQVGTIRCAGFAPDIAGVVRDFGREFCGLDGSRVAGSNGAVGRGPARTDDGDASPVPIGSFRRLEDAVVFAEQLSEDQLPLKSQSLPDDLVN